MATRIYLRTTENIYADPPAIGRDMVTAAGSVAREAVAGVLSGQSTHVRLSEAAQDLDWISEPVAAQVTISGQIAISIWPARDGLAPAANIRVKLYKRTTSGSVETLIAEAVTSAALGFYPGSRSLLTVTPPVSVVVAPYERFILRAWAEPSGATYDADSDVQLWYASDVAEAAESYVEFTETVTWIPNETRLFLRRTNTIGIGNFMDLIDVLGSTAATSAVVNTKTGSSVELEIPSTPSGGVDTAASIASTTNATTYASASFTPAVNKLYLLAVVTADAAPETTIPTIATTTGLVFVQVATGVFDSIASNVHRLTLFRAMKASGLSAGTYTVTLADAGTACCAQLTEFDGVVTTGTDGADAVINVSSNNADAGANPSVTLAAFTHVNNWSYACFGSDIATVPTKGANWIGFPHQTIGTPTTSLFTEWQNQNDTSADLTLAASDWAGIAVELVAGTPPPMVEWITKRFARPWNFPGAPSAVSLFLQYSVYAGEGNTLANCSIRTKLYRWRAGVETLFYTEDWQSELAASLTSSVVANSGRTTGVTQIQMAFHEDDRMVLRMWVIPAPTLTMAAGYVVTVNYDHNVDPSQNTWLTLDTAVGWKGESDPAEIPIPDGLSLSGLGN